jgi:hypothetical protein
MKTDGARGVGGGGEEHEICVRSFGHIIYVNDKHRVTFDSTEWVEIGGFRNTRLTQPQASHLNENIV